MTNHITANYQVFVQLLVGAPIAKLCTVP